MNKLLEFYKNNQVWLMVLGFSLGLSGIVLEITGDRVLGAILSSAASPMLAIYYYEKKKTMMALASLAIWNTATASLMSFSAGLVTFLMAVLLFLASRESEK
jgi:hypothetical protein